ncbi:MAG: ABC transporter permease subunit [Leptospiraceae bacterium]|nr:ABC transporter permease subunit [Leptospiraceae bacterium]
MIELSETTKKRYAKFKKNKIAYYSFLIILITYIISLFAPILVNNTPLLIKYQGNLFFPIFQFYPETSFGGKESTEANYKLLAKEKKFSEDGNFILFPIVPYGMNESHLDELTENEFPPSPPSSKHWLGTDDRARDVFTRIFYGYRISLTFAFILIFFEMLLGIIIGSIQGYFSGNIDISIQVAIEILSSIPFLYMILIMGSFFGRSFSILLFTYAIFGWIGISYYVRGEFYKLRNIQYVEAARAFGISNFRIIFRHILPNALTPIVTFFPFSLIGSISILSALDFLGYGIPAPNPSWGELIGQGRERLSAWWLITFPSLALFLTIQLTSFIGDGLRDAYDSKEKSGLS